MKLRHVSFRLQRVIAHRGVVGALGSVVKRIMGSFSRRFKPAAPPKKFDPVHPFDIEHGTDTSGWIIPEELRDSRRKRNFDNAGFFATAPSLFHQAMARMQLDLERFTFVDLGAGKGRILLLASNLPFQRVVGVELVPELQAAATRNISLYQPAARRCQNVQCILGDVTDFAFPTVPLVIFLWNPFVGAVFERVMDNLEDSLRRAPREVYLLYLKPDYRHLIERIPSLHTVWEASLTMTEQDYQAFAFPHPSEVCVAYGTAGADL